MALKLAKDSFFHRPALARHFLQLLESADTASGLFLAAPRRTGKTTFIKQDLVPLLKQEGAFVIYADLWEDKAVDPAVVVANAIRAAIAEHDGFIIKGAKATGLTRFKLAGFEMDLGKAGAPVGESLARTLAALSKVAQAPLILVIDEAQHAGASESGRNMLFALKAARDALMHDPDSAGFRLLATGSNTERLTALVNAKDQAFYLAPMESLDVLDADYLKWLQANAGSRPMPSLKALKAAFALGGHRPEPLREALTQLGKALATGKPGAQASIDTRFDEFAQAVLDKERALFVQTFNDLDPLDAAILQRMAEMEKAFSPSDQQALAAYDASLAKYAGMKDAGTTRAAVQTSLERLRKKNLVWNMERGAWFIEDGRQVQWVRELRG